MALETATKITELNDSYPVGASDTPASLDDHLRLIKAVLKADVMAASTVHAATSKTTPVDADEIPLLDSAASYGLKRMPASAVAKSGAITSSGNTMSTARLLGRTTASTGAVEEISVGGNLTLSAGVLSITTFQTGTKMLFAQASAPTGWTQVTTDAENNRMLRVVNTSGGGTGGSHSPVLMDVVPSHTHGFTSGGQSATHTHAVSDPGHYHAGAQRKDQALYGSGYDEWYVQSTTVTGAAYTGITLGNASVDHTHSGTTNANGSASNWTPRYLDLIVCSKNA